MSRPTASWRSVPAGSRQIVRRQYKAGGLIPIEIRDGWIVAHEPEFLLVLNREQFTEGLKRGEA
jgi:hypothetical protein